MIGNSDARDVPRRYRVELIPTASVWPLVCERLDIALLVN